MSAFDLTGRVAIITGGNGGIGLGIARGLIDAGAKIVISGRDAGKGALAVKSLGLNAMFLPADVSDRRHCFSLVGGAVAALGRLDIMIANAGTAIRHQPQDYTVEEWHSVIDINLSSAFFCAQAAYPELVRSGGGKIVTIGSMMSIFGASHAVPYGASKGGIVQMTRGLAAAWARDNIQVNSILPGWIETDLTAGAKAQVEGLDAKVVARTPAGRWGQPADLAGLAVFLSSSASDFVTGTAIPVDGGFSIQG